MADEELKDLGNEKLNELLEELVDNREMEERLMDDHLDNARLFHEARGRKKALQETINLLVDMFYEKEDDGFNIPTSNGEE